jgi:hypothetical protein
MSKNGGWGGFIELHAISHLLNIQINIFIDIESNPIETVGIEF